jgi:hypothetical protein
MRIGRDETQCFNNHMSAIEARSLLVDKATVPVTVIRAPKGLIRVKLRGLWMCPELLYFFTWRDIKAPSNQESKWLPKVVSIDIRKVVK